MSNIVYEIVRANPQVLKHSEIVRELLKMGQRVDSSEAVHRILMELVTTGAIIRQEVELVRRYMCMSQ